VATIEGKVIDVFSGRGVMWSIVQVLKDDKSTKVGEAHTGEDGLFVVDNVPEGERYWVCVFSQLYQPLCFELKDKEGEWTPLPEEGRSVQINVTRVTLGVPQGPADTTGVEVME